MCGIVNVTAKSWEPCIKTGFVARNAIEALEHRGNDSVGIVFNRGNFIETPEKSKGRVIAVITDQLIKENPCISASVQVRYAITGSSRNMQNSQPLWVKYKGRVLTLVHNGNLVNAPTLKKWLISKGVDFFSTTDTEVILQLIVYYMTQGYKKRQAIQKTMRRCVGAYSCILMDRDASYAFRDPYGFRPLKLAENDGYYFIASESIAWHKYQANYLRDIKPGEILKLTPQGYTSFSAIQPRKFQAHCIFELIYLMSDHSLLTSEVSQQLGFSSVAQVRKMLGRQLHQEHPLGPGIVMPILGTGNFHAQGYYNSHSLANPGLSFWATPLLKDQTVGRVFLDDIADQEEKLRIKFIRLFDSISWEINFLANTLPPKEKINLIWVDDSLVRSKTAKFLIKLIRNTLQETYPKLYHRFKVCWVLGSPPYTSACYWGIETANESELAINKYGSIEGIRKNIGSDYLGYLSIAGLKNIFGAQFQHYCSACFTGKQRTKISGPQGLESLS